MVLTIRRRQVICARPVYSAIWFGLWFLSAGFFVIGAIWGSGDKWLGWPIAAFNLALGLLIPLTTSAVVGPSGVSMALPWTRTFHVSEISRVFCGPLRSRYSVAVEMLDGSDHILLGGGYAGWLGDTRVVRKLETARDEIESALRHGQADK